MTKKQLEFKFGEEVLRNLRWVEKGRPNYNMRKEEWNRFLEAMFLYRRVREPNWDKVNDWALPRFCKPRGK